MSLAGRLALATALPLRHALNLGLNVGGIVLPVLAGVLAIPALVRNLGTEGFATLALGWTVVGYFSLLDLGLGRALTMHIASRTTPDTSHAAAAIARIGRRLMLSLGLLWTLVLLAMLPLIIQHWPILSAQSTSPVIAWASLVLCIPFTLWMNSSNSILEAESRFVQVNAVRIPAGVATYVAPLLISMHARDMAWVFASLLLTRVAGAAVLAWLVRDRFSPTASELTTSEIGSLLRFGGWMTVSQIVGPALVYFDRFAIAGIVSVGAVTYYTVSFDVLTRLPLFAMAVISVLFPIFVQAQDGAGGVLDDASRTARNTLRLLLAIWTPAMIFAAGLGPMLLRLWLGNDVARETEPVWRWLIVGVAVNGLAHLPLNLLQSRARTDVIACFHLLQLPPYLIGLWWALTTHGIAGAAFVWTLRVTVDAILLHVSAAHILPHWRPLLRVSLLASVATAGALGAIALTRS